MVDVNGYKNKISYLRIWNRNDDSVVRDVSNSATSISWKTDLATADELTFEIQIAKDGYMPSNGDQVTMAWNDKDIFTGWIFKRKIADNGVISITSYSNSRYLKGTGTYVWSASTSAERFEKIANDLSLPFEVVDRSDYRAEEEVTDGSTFFDMVDSVFKKTKTATGKQYFLIDAPNGTLKHVSADRMATDMLLTDQDSLTSWSLENSIEDMSNVVQVVHEDNETKAREIRVAKSDDSIKKYGMLVHTETISGDTNTAQLQDKANSLLGEKNGQSKTLTIKALGDTNVRAGTSMYVSINGITNDNLPKNQKILVTSCTHNFDTNWTMDLEVTMQ